MPLQVPKGTRLCRHLDSALNWENAFLFSATQFVGLCEKSQEMNRPLSGLLIFHLLGDLDHEVGSLCLQPPKHHHSSL